MKGLLFYDAEGARRNKWFINRLIEAAQELGHNLELVIHEGRSDEAFIAPVAFALVRTICPELTKEAESRAIHTFNNYSTAFTANDKWQTYLLAKKLGLDVMDTKAVADAEEAMTAFPFPLILKTVDGHGGSEVFMAETAEKCKEIFSLLGDKRVIAQKVCSEPGIDMRVYVLGGEILACVKRSSETDFRSNFSLGGRAEVVHPDEGVKMAVRRIYGELKCDFVGIDFIRHDGKWILNEIEDVVGTRMLYAKTDIDPAYEYMRYITHKIEKAEEICTTN